jgi:thioredoxin:protein disulfide reductase
MSLRFLSRSWSSCLLGLMLGMFLSLSAHAADDFLPVEEAFKFEAVASANGGVQLRFNIAPKTHLYRDRLSFKGVPDAVAFGTPEMPEGKRQYDETFGKEVEVYYERLDINLPVVAAAGGAFLKLGYQGCADEGLCYPPQTRFFKLIVAEGGKVSAVEAVTQEDAEKATASAPAASGAATAAASKATASGGASSSGSSIENALASGSLLKIVGVFFVAGLLLSFTPCVLPMVPILSSIIVGEGQNVSRLRGFMLALSYSQGMAVVYTGLGVAAGLLGEGLAAYLQTPAVLGTFGVLLVLFSLSMFGAYELQMPSFIQGRLTERSGQMKGGSLIGVFIMGLISALIVGPCVTGPLAGALVYISQTHDVVLGGSALYALAWGMSMPLLLVGVSAGSLLPRTGMWMESVKTVFGMLMLGVAWWLVSPVLPAWALLGTAGLWLLLGGAFMGAFDTIGPQASVLHRTLKAFGFAMVVLGVFQLLGAVTGASSPWAPLSTVLNKTVVTAQAAVPGASSPAATEGLAFKKVRTPEELDAALAEAKSQGKDAMVDFYADWCVACKEMEHMTFTNAEVKAWMGQSVLIQADVTDVTDGTKALLKRFGLFGPPGIIFFDAAGSEVKEARVIGFQKPEEFMVSLKKVRS